MSLKPVTAFEEVFEKQTRDAEMLQEAYSGMAVKQGEMHKKASSIANSALRDYIAYQYNKGKQVKFTPRVKALIERQQQLLLKDGMLNISSAANAGQCLVCGKHLWSGDMALVEKYENSNAVCFVCLTSANTVEKDGDSDLVLYN